MLGEGKGWRKGGNSVEQMKGNSWLDLSFLRVEGACS